eukprot:SAG11_NODE_862_length_6840_cov_35.328586_7_plen_146_part_00
MQNRWPLTRQRKRIAGGCGSTEMAQTSSLHLAEVSAQRHPLSVLCDLRSVLELFPLPPLLCCGRFPHFMSRIWQTAADSARTEIAGDIGARTQLGDTLQSSLVSAKAAVKFYYSLDGQNHESVRGSRTFRFHRAHALISDSSRRS